MKLKYFFQRIKCLLSNRHFLFFFIKISSIKLICFVFFIQIFSMQRNIFCVAGGALWSVRRPGRQTQLLRGSRLSLLQGFLQEVNQWKLGEIRGALHFWTFQTIQTIKLPQLIFSVDVYSNFCRLFLLMAFFPSA